MLSPRYIFAAVMLHGQIYAIGGWNGTQALASVEVYDPTSNTWSYDPSLPQAEEGPGAAVDPSGHIDVIGGSDSVSTYYNNVYLWTGNGWSNGAGLPQATYAAGVTLGPDGQIYAIGGYNNGFQATVQVYNPTSNSWSTVAPLPTATCCMGTVTAPNGQLYAIGGDGPGPTNRVAIYGPSITASPTSGLPGSTTTVSGTGFTPGGGVSIYLGPTGGQLLAQGTASTSGHINLAAVIPVTAPIGQNTLTALDTSANYPVNTPFTVMMSGAIPWHPHYSARLSAQINATVDLADGYVELSADDMLIPARGPNLGLRHIWDSVYARTKLAGATGHGWLTSLTPSIGGVLTGTVNYTDASGAVWPFVYVGSPSATGPYTTYQTPPGLPWALTTARTGSTTSYTLTNVLNGAVGVFDTLGRLASDSDGYGNSNTVAYGSAGPTSETNSGGRALQLSYGRKSGLLSTVQSPWSFSSKGAQGQEVTYAYTGTNLGTMTWGAGTSDARTASFGYSPDGTQLVTVTTPGSHQFVIGYDSVGRVSAITSTTAPAYVTQFTYTPGQTQLVEGFGSAAPLTTTYTLSPQGEPITVTDALSDSVSATYDADHDVLTSTDANSNTTTNYYQYVGPPGPGGLGSTGLVTETDRPAIDSTGPVTTAYAYDANNNLIQTVSGNGGLTYYQYDVPHHSVITTTQQLGVTGCGITTQPALQPLRATRRRTAGATTSSASCQPANTWRATVNQLDPYGELTGVVDGRGLDVADTPPGTVPTPTLNANAITATHSYTYTPQGDLAKAWTPPITTISGTAPVTTSFGYDADGDVSAITSPNGALTSDSYDHLGRLTQTTQPVVGLYDSTSRAPVQQIGYDGDGNVARTTDGAGDPTTYNYDPLGRLVSMTNAISGTTLLTYTGAELSAVQDPAGVVTQYGHDAAGRRADVTDAAGAVTAYGQDGVGNTTGITTPLDYAGGAGSTVEARDFDPLDELITDTVSGVGSGVPSVPRATGLAYDRDGNATQVTLPNNGLTFQDYDLADRLTGVDIAPTPGTFVFVSEKLRLDAANNVADVTDFSRRDHSSTFDGANRPIQRVDLCVVCTNALITTTPSFDPDGNVRGLHQLTDGVGQTGAYTATYNAADWLSSQDDGQGQTSYQYDLAGRPRTSSLAGGAGRVQATLDKAGRATNVSETLTDTISGTPVVSSSTSLFGDDGDNLPLTATLGAGTANLQEQRTYDSNERPQTLAIGSLAATAPLSFTEQDVHDPQGHTILSTPTLNGYVATAQSITTTPAGEIYRDDAAPQGSGLPTPFLTGQRSWHYDAAGNLLDGPPPFGGSPTAYAYSYPSPSAPLTPDNWLPNELVLKRYQNSGFSSSTNEYAYDKGGNTTTISQTTTVYVNGQTAVLTHTISLGYDATGRVTSVSYDDGRHASLGYNARGLRDRFVLHTTDGSTVSEQLRYRGSQVGQVVVTNTPAMGATATYTETFLYRQDGAPLELLYSVAGQRTQRYWYVLDARGSVVALTDNGGHVVDHYAYDEWGAPDVWDTGVTGEALPQPLRYRGYWYDGWIDEQPAPQPALQPVTAGTVPWYLLGMRYYDPLLERFLQPNPGAGTPDYVYAHDDPLDQCDATGLAIGCPQQHGQVIRGAPYDPRRFTMAQQPLAQLFGLLLFGLLGTPGEGIGAGAGAEADAGVAATSAATRDVLVVGESETFEYSMNLAEQNPAWRITATRLDSLNPAAVPKLPPNLTVLGGVDATDLGAQFETNAFDDIVFNAPRSINGWQRESGDLVDNVLASARDSGVLRAGGTVRFSSSGNMPTMRRLAGHAAGGTAGFPLPGGYAVPYVRPYLDEPNFGVPYTIMKNEGIPLDLQPSDLNWYEFTRT